MAVMDQTGSTPEIQAMKEEGLALTMENWLAYIYPTGLGDAEAMDLEIPEEIIDRPEDAPIPPSRPSASSEPK